MGGFKVSQEHAFTDQKLNFKKEVNSIFFQFQEAFIKTSFGKEKDFRDLSFTGV